MTCEILNSKVCEKLKEIHKNIKFSKHLNSLKSHRFLLLLLTQTHLEF